MQFAKSFVLFLCSG